MSKEEHCTEGPNMSDSITSTCKNTWFYLKNVSKRKHCQYK